MPVDAVCTIPSAECEATTKAYEYLSLAMNLKNQAVTQYINYNFNSIVEFDGVVYGASRDGLFTLDDAQTDNGAPIDAFFEFWIGDAGAINAKRIRALHFGLEANGNMTVEVTDDDGTSKVYDITIEKTSSPGLAGYTQHGVRIFVERTHIGRYWKLKMSNFDSSDFSVDRVDVTWNIMAGSKQRGR